MAEEKLTSPSETNSASATTVAYDDETILWQGRPSQWVNLSTFLGWGGALVLISILLVFWQAGLYQHYAPWIDQWVRLGAYLFMIVGLWHLLYAYLTVRCEHTVITPNKIKESKGITRIFRRELFCEMSDIVDVQSPPAGLLGLVGLSTLVIETKDHDQPTIAIRAIRDRQQLVDKLLPVWRKLKMERKGYFGGH